MELDENVVAYIDNPRVYVDGIGWLWLSYECIQDCHAQLKTMFLRRTPEFTEKEIKEWQEVWEIIKDCNFEDIKRKYKMKIFSEEETLSEEE